MLRKSLLGLSFLILFTSFALAAGAPYWATNGVTLTATSGTANTNFVYGVVNDGSGNFIVAWGKGLTTDRNVYAQKVDASGVPQWSVPVPICEAAEAQRMIQIVADGSGGAIIAWLDRRDGVADNIYAQRVNSSGSVLWSIDGKMVMHRPFDAISSSLRRLKMMGDGRGGAILACEIWINRPLGTSYDIYGQKINGSGDFQWPAAAPTLEGINIFGWVNNQQNPALVSYLPAGSADVGAFIACEDSEKGSTIKLQKVDPAGNLLWGSTGVFMNFISGNFFQENPAILDDGVGGVFAVCEQSGGKPPPYGTGPLLAQRLEASTGTWEVWGRSGVNVYDASLATGMLLNPQIASDGAGGIVVAWSDGRNYAAPDQNQFDIYIQRLDGTGARLYSSPMPICTAAGLQLLNVGTSTVFNSLITANGYGLVTWNDFRRAPGIKYNVTVFDGPPASFVTWETDVYAQKFQISDGSPSWLLDGVPLTTASNLQLFPSLAGDGSGGGVVAFTDARYADVNNLWAMAQRVTDIDPTITSVTTSSSIVIRGTDAALNNFGCDPRPNWGGTTYLGTLNYVTLDGSQVDLANVVSWDPKTIVVHGNESVGPHAAAVTAYGVTAAKNFIIPGPGPVFSDEYINDKKYIARDIIPAHFTLKAKLESPLGLDIAGINLRIDSRDPVINIPLSSYSATTKTLTYNHPDALLEGPHTLDLWAKDIYDNYGPVDSLSVTVGGEPVLNPIPLFDGTHPTTISFVLPTAANVVLRIYSLDGSVAWESGTINATWGYNEYLWDGKNSAGQLMGNGVYPIAMSVNGAWKCKGHLVISYK